MEIEVNKKDVDLRYVFGMLFLWIGAGLVVLIFIDFMMNVKINPMEGYHTHIHFGVKGENEKAVA